MGSSGLSECSGVPVFRMSGSQRRDAVAGGSGEHCLWRETQELSAQMWHKDLQERGHTRYGHSSLSPDFLNEGFLALPPMLALHRIRSPLLSDLTGDQTPAKEWPLSLQS